MERRHTSQPISLADESRNITGLGAVYYDGSDGTQYRLWDNVYERILPGAFDRAIAEDDVRGLFNHDSNMVLGRTSAGTMTLSSTRGGLKYVIRPADTTVARDVAEHISRGDVTGSSFAFRVTEENWRTEEPDTEQEREIREIREVSLYDVGPVTFPAYSGSTAETNSEARSAYEAYIATRASHATEDETEEDDAAEMPGIDLATYTARVRAAQSTLD